VPDWSAGDYVMFVLAAFQTGLVGGWKVVAAVTTLAGGSVAAHAVAIREFTLPWAVLALLVIFATVFAIGACTLYRECTQSRLGSPRRGSLYKSEPTPCGRSITLARMGQTRTQDSERDSPPRTR